MDRSPLKWAILVGIIMIVVGIASSLQVGPDAAYSAPEAQATATNTPTNTLTPTLTSTPTPAICSLGGVALYCPHASGGNNLLGVSIENSGASGSSSMSVQGAVANGTAVPRPLILGASDFSGNATTLQAGAPDDLASTSLVRLNTGALMIGRDVANSHDMPVRIEPTRGALMVDSRTNQVAAAATIVLPAQTPVAYAVSDAMAASSPAPITLAGMCRQNGGSGTITKVRQLTDQTSNTARIRLHLFNTSPSAIADNAPFTLLFSTATSYIGYVDLPPNATEGSGSTAAGAVNSDVRLAYACAAADTALYGIPSPLDIFTPASAQNWFWSVLTVRD